MYFGLCVSIIDFNNLDKKIFKITVLQNAQFLVMTHVVKANYPMYPLSIHERHRHDRGSI